MATFGDILLFIIGYGLCLLLLWTGVYFLTRREESPRAGRIAIRSFLAAFILAVATRFLLSIGGC